MLILNFVFQIPVENLINLNQKQIDVTIQRKTNGKNMKVSVNTLPETNMAETSLSMVGWNGKFYQISLPPMKSNETIGNGIINVHSVLYLGYNIYHHLNANIFRYVCVHKPNNYDWFKS